MCSCIDHECDGVPVIVQEASRDASSATAVVGRSASEQAPGEGTDQRVVDIPAADFASADGESAQDSDDEERSQRLAASKARKKRSSFADEHSTTRSAAPKKPRRRTREQDEQDALALKEMCKTPEDFVHSIIYSTIPKERAQQEHPQADADRAQFLEYAQVRRAMAAAGMDFWFAIFPHAMHMAVSLMGIDHLTLDTQRAYHEADGVPEKRTFWHMCYRVAAIETHHLGRDRSHAFVEEVYNMTMRDFCVPTAEWNHRTGCALKHADGQGGRREVFHVDASQSWKFKPRVLCSRVLPTGVIALEMPLARKSKCNALAAFNHAKSAARSVIYQTMVAGTAQVSTGSHLDIMSLVGGDGKGGVWSSSGSLSMVPGGRGVYNPSLAHPQIEFLQGLQFVQFNPGHTCMVQCVRLCACLQ